MTTQPAATLGVQRIHGTWMLFEHLPNGEIQGMAVFADGKQAARFCNLVRVMSSTTPGEQVLVRIHLPEAILAQLQGEA